MPNIIYSLVNHSLLDGIITTDIFARKDISVIIAIDEEIAKNAILEEIFKFSVCNKYILEIVTKEEALKILTGNKYQNHRIGLTSRTLSNFIYLFDNNINLGECCLTDNITSVFSSNIKEEMKNIDYLKKKNYEIGILKNSNSKKILI